MSDSNATVITACALISISKSFEAIPPNVAYYTCGVAVWKSMAIFERTLGNSIVSFLRDVATLVNWTS